MMTVIAKAKYSVFVASLIMMFTCRIGAQVIKLATLAPRGSSWHELLMAVGERCDRGTEGQLRLRIYPGGVAGDERDMVRKMQIGQIHAAVVSVEGLGDLSPSINALYVPLLVDSLDRLERIQSDLFPVVSGELKDKGIELLAWLNVGWVYLFSRKQVSTPEDLKGLKIFSWAGNYRTTQLWSEAGFHPVPLAFTDVLTALQTGMIDAVPGFPFLVLAYQWFALAPHMLNLRWIPVTVALVVDTRVWESIPAEKRRVIMEAVHWAQEKSDELVAESGHVVDVMETHGLKVHELNHDQRQLWIDLSTNMYPLIRGRLVPEEIFGRVTGKNR